MKTVEICRCCLSDECFKDLCNEYYFGNQREVYGDMLVDIFNIKISEAEGYRQLICEKCIIQLRSAAAFKTQVQRSEQTVVNGLTSGVIEVDVQIKEEPEDFTDHITGTFDDDSSSSPAGRDDGDDGFDWQNDDDVNIASLIKDKKEMPRTSKSEKPRKYVMNKNTKKMAPKQTDKSQIKNERMKTRLKSEDKSRKRLRKTENEIETPAISQSQINLKENTIKLIENSNICLFESSKTKFKCFYCKTQFIDVNDLREHSVTHANENYIKLCISRMRGLSYKLVDISALTCKLCKRSLVDLSELQTHLSETHNIEFTDSEHLLIPYRLANGFSCVICSEKFNSFFTLSVHMNKHYRNNVCEICGLSYVNRLSLRMHVHSIHKEKVCNICSVTFPSYNAKVKHMRKNHDWSSSKRYCLVCNKTFRYSYNLTEHQVQEHGLVRERSACQECGKTFLSPQNLKIHTRSVHMKERNHPCSYCGMSFFTTCDQRRHERTHQDIRSFSCTLCEGKFKYKDSLRRHMKRQHGRLNTDSNLSQ